MNLYLRLMSTVNVTCIHLSQGLVPVTIAGKDGNEWSYSTDV